MKKYYAAFFWLLSLVSYAQIVRTPTGASFKYGQNRNPDGIGFWSYAYSDNGSAMDSTIKVSETANAIELKGNNYQFNGSVPDIGIIFFLNSNSLDLSNPSHMMLKIRMRNAGTLRGITYVKIRDTLGTETLCQDCMLVIDSLTDEFQDYYFSYHGKMVDPYQHRQVDSSMIWGYSMHFYFGPSEEATNLSEFKLEIEEVQLGSQVLWNNNTIKGKIFNDVNGDCVFNGNDTPVSGGLVKANPGSWYGLSDANGNYEVKTDTLHEEYTVSRVRSAVQNELLVSTCPASGEHVVATSGSNNFYEGNDFAETSLQCSRLHINISSDRRRRCFRANTIVSYGNRGTSAADFVEVRVVYPDYVVPVSSTPAWSRKEGNILFYTISSVAPNEMQKIHIIDSVKCGDEGIRGLTQCTKAFISPSNLCHQSHPSWDHSSVDVQAVCSNGIAQFSISNIGDGAMSDSLSFHLYENDTIIKTGKFKLAPNEYFTLSLPAEGNFLFLIAQQSPYHLSQELDVRAYLEGCINSSNSDIKAEMKGLMMGNMQEPVREEEAIACDIIIDSYDPNDKAATPVGKGEAHYILAGTPLNYKIRFENTGSDTAYKVVVVDTLDLNLDVSSFEAGAGSHVYKTSVSGSEKAVYTFSFNNINLPPKSTDSVKCHGFVSFSVRALSSLADGAVISNKAEIYFDYNSAIVTNLVTHTIGDPVEYTDLTKGNIVTQSSIVLSTQNAGEATAGKLYPNPARETITIQTSLSGEISILNTEGKIVLKASVDGNTSLSVKSLPAGLYFYKISDTTGISTAGKFFKVD